MTTILMAAVAFVLVAGVTFAIGALLLRVLPTVRAARLAPASSSASVGDVSILRWEDRLPREWQIMVERLGRWLTPRDVGLLAGYRKRLILAGFHNPSAVALFLGAKASIAIALGFAYLVYGAVIQRALPNLLPTCIILGGLGFFLPDVWLRLRQRRRQREVSNALPDVLDLLMVCVEAGMGFDAAVARVAEQPASKGSPLHAELYRMHLEVRAGRPREEALRALADRLGIEEVRAVVGSFIQTDKLGTPLGKTLRVQAEASRVQRRHRAETRAQLVPLLMLGPTILFLMPSFMLVAMAPSLLRIFQILSTIGK
jgi:tight adherence protein C